MCLLTTTQLAVSSEARRDYQMASNSTGTSDTGSTPARSTSRSARSRRPQLRGDLLLASLAEQVDQLIKENQQLKRDLARAERGQGGGGLGSAARALAGLQRRVSRQLSGGSSPRRRATAPSREPARRPRRKGTHPQLPARRRQ